MVKAVSDRVLEYIRGRDDYLIEVLRHLVEAESPSAHPSSHEPTRRALIGPFRELGLHVREVGPPGGPRHIYARPAKRNRDAPTQLIVGHYDTVWPVGTLAERPFSVAGNIIRGPGVFDMKGGLVQIVLALKAIQHLNLAIALTPLIFVNADEEIGSRTSTRYIRWLARHANRAFILEPSMGEGGKLKTERKGIGKFTVTVFGKAAHAGLDPESGASAILELSHVIQKLFAMNDADKGISVNVGTVDGGIQPNVVAPHSTAVVDVRVPTIDDGKQIQESIFAIKPVVPGIRLRIDGGIGRPSMEATPRNRALWQQAERFGAELSLDLHHAMAGGGSDGNTTSQYTATLDGLGPVGGGAHAKHEFLYIDKTLERAALLTMLMLGPEIAA